MSLNSDHFMNKEKPKHYDPGAVEEKWYGYWMDKQYFKSIPDDREAFTIVIPPPNVTGILHMGHMLNNTIQDILIRKARLDGKNACWVPGTDHASIATEAKVVKWLREELNVKKSDLTREQFMDYAHQWKEKYGGIILQQLKKLGASCDWDRTAFTMDATRYDCVIQSFVDLYNRGFLYRDYRMVNWDPVAQTVLSNEEVIYSEESGTLYHVRYRVQDTDDYITIATTRPETILGDTAVAVHPEDPRYVSYHGKRVLVPLVDRAVPIIADEYVDQQFGTGALKITPAHDVNDYEIGKKHDLEIIDILNPDATLSAAAQLFVGLDRDEARTLVVRRLEEEGYLVKTEDYTHNVGRSERSHAVVEPRRSLQWYVRMKDLAEPALRAVEEDTIRFFPENQKNTYRHWMRNIRDWCISRQLWWGQRIPAYYYQDQVFVATTKEEALEQARAHFNNALIQSDDLSQDEDVLDTWFSSWLWPMSVFGTLDSNEDLDYYYPTSVLVTGWDIIFLWVARMIIAGYQWQGTKPFEHVYFTGMVRDRKGRKMSKSLGNSPDALELIQNYGADGVRFGMLSCSPAGGDLLFDEKLCEQGKNFCNKIWNGLNFLTSRSVSAKIEPGQGDELAYAWFSQKLSQHLQQTNALYKEYRLSQILISNYSLIWNDFFSQYLEMIKPASGASFSDRTFGQAKELFGKLMIILHPFMPFITEEVWHQLEDRRIGEDVIVASYPQEEVETDPRLIKDMQLLIELVSKIREIRSAKSMKWNAPMELYIKKSDQLSPSLYEGRWVALLSKMAVLDEIHFVEEEPGALLSIVIGTDKFFVDPKVTMDVQAELQKLHAELEYQQGFVSSVEQKLDNDRFVSNAPESVVNNERKKLADGLARINMLKESIRQLEQM